MVSCDSLLEHREGWTLSLILQVVYLKLLFITTPFFCDMAINGHINSMSISLTSRDRWKGIDTLILRCLDSFSTYLIHRWGANGDIVNHRASHSSKVNSPMLKIKGNQEKRGRPEGWGLRKEAVSWLRREKNQEEMRRCKKKKYILKVRGDTILRGTLCGPQNYEEI